MHVKTEFEKSWKELREFFCFVEFLGVGKIMYLTEVRFKEIEQDLIPAEHMLGIFLQEFLKKHSYSWLISFQLARYNF